MGGVDASAPTTNFGATTTLLVDQAAIAYESYLRFSSRTGAQSPQLVIVPEDVVTTGRLGLRQRPSPRQGLLR